jgi:hypothetical protein
MGVHRFTAASFTPAPSIDHIRRLVVWFSAFPVADFLTRVGPNAFLPELTPHKCTSEYTRRHTREFQQLLLNLNSRPWSVVIFHQQQQSAYYNLLRLTGPTASNRCRSFS